GRHPARGRARAQAEARAVDQPIVPVPDRERSPPPPDQLDAPPPGKVLQRPPRLPGRRSRGLSERAHLGRGHAGGPARPLADQRRRAFPPPSGGQPGVARRRPPPPLAPASNARLTSGWRRKRSAPLISQRSSRS